jgi:hypothetical protein
MSEPRIFVAVIVLVGLSGISFAARSLCGLSFLHDLKGEVRAGKLLIALPNLFLAVAGGVGGVLCIVQPHTRNVAGVLVVIAICSVFYFLQHLHISMSDRGGAGSVFLAATAFVHIGGILLLAMLLWTGYEVDGILLAGITAAACVNALGAIGPILSPTFRSDASFAATRMIAGDPMFLIPRFHSDRRNTLGERFNRTIVTLLYVEYSVVHVVTMLLASFLASTSL